MTPYSTASALLGMLVMTRVAVADERPVPRQPIGPPQDFQMLPVQKSPLLTNDNIRIVNKGDQKLSISYWDGRSTWQPEAIDVSGSTDISCAPCAGTIIVVYHDGIQNQRISLKAGSTYWIGWSTSKGAWLLTSPPN
jgi:hypothetical protein